MHVDYYCCAICDTEISFGGYPAQSKERLCGRCVERLDEHGISAPDVAALVSWIEQTDRDIVEQVLDSVGFQACELWNRVDDAVSRKGIKRWKRHVHRLPY